MHSLRIFCACLLGVGASLLSTTGAVWASESVGYIPPGLYLRLSDAETGGTVQVQVRLAQVNHLIQTEGRKAILLAQKNNSWPDLDLKLKEFKFVEFSPGSPTISVVIELESKFGDCKIRPRLQMRSSVLAETKFVNDGSKTDCSNFIFSGLIEHELTKAMIKGISEGRFFDEKTLQEWMALDPEWGAFAAKATASLTYCEAELTKDPALCFDLKWPRPDDLKRYRDGLIANAPMASGPADRERSQAAAKAYFDLAIVRNVKTNTKEQIPYPAEVGADGRFNDFDMVLFGGLGCLAGEQTSCELVRRSQSPSGQFWRSPDRKDVMPSPGGAAFSGDAFNGVVAFLAAAPAPTVSSNLPTPKEQFRRYMAYIRGNTQTIGGTTVYKSCSGDDAFQCVLAGPEWYWLNLLAKKFDLVEEIPSDMRDPKGKFGFDESMMLWQTALVPAGYRLHLTAVQVALARKLTGDSPTLKAVAASLAGRQPKNPFHLFLHLGPDKLAQHHTEQACDIARPQVQYTDWTWQRATRAEAWKESMRWDCIFMHRLLM